MRRRSWTVMAALAMAMAMAVALAGCGSGGSGGGGGSGLEALSAEEIRASALEAFQAAESVRVQGTMVTGGGETNIDLRLTQGGDSQVSVSTASIHLELIKLGDRTWFRSPEAIAQVGPEVAAAVGDRWVLVTPVLNPEQLLSMALVLTDLRTFGEELLSTPSGLEKVEGETVAGVPTVGLRDADGMTLHIAAEGEPYPLLITPAADQDQSKRVEFSGYNQDPGISAPQNAVNDIEALIAQAVLE